jgi:hypothetical protein
MLVEIDKWPIGENRGRIWISEGGMWFLKTP